MEVGELVEVAGSLLAALEEAAVGVAMAAAVAGQVVQRVAVVGLAVSVEAV